MIEQTVSHRKILDSPDEGGSGKLCTTHGVRVYNALALSYFP